MSILTTAELLSPPAAVAQEAQARVSALKRDDAANTRVGINFSASLDSPEVKKKAYEDVKEIASRVIDIRGSFTMVSGILTLWDFWGMKDAQGQAVILGPKWKALFDVRPGIFHSPSRVVDCLWDQIRRTLRQR